LGFEVGKANAASGAFEALRDWDWLWV